jgi:hypothetical protein
MQHTKTLQVVTLPQSNTRDVVDYVVYEKEELRLTTSESILSPPISPTIEATMDQDVPMHEENFEFSDVEPEQDPNRKRTRSQSRIKENSVPPPEPVQKQKKVRRGAKAVDGVSQKPRRRRVIHEEPAELNTDDEA